MTHIIWLISYDSYPQMIQFWIPYRLICSAFDAANSWLAVTVWCASRGSFSCIKFKKMFKCYQNWQKWTTNLEIKWFECINKTPIKVKSSNKNWQNDTFINIEVRNESNCMHTQKLSYQNCFWNCIQVNSFLKQQSPQWPHVLYLKF